MNIINNNTNSLDSAFGVLSQSIECFKNSSSSPHSLDAVLRAFVVVRRILASRPNAEIQTQLCKYSQELTSLLPRQNGINLSETRPLDLLDLVQGQFIKVFEKKSFVFEKKSFEVLSQSIECFKNNSSSPHSFEAVLRAFVVVRRILAPCPNAEIQTQLCKYSQELTSLLPGENWINLFEARHLELLDLVQDQFIKIFERKTSLQVNCASRFPIYFKLYTLLSHLKEGSPLWDKDCFLNFFQSLSKKDQEALARHCREADQKEKMKAQQELSKALAGMQSKLAKAVMKAASEPLLLTPQENLSGEKLIRWALSQLPKGVDAWREAFKVFLDPFLKQKVEKLNPQEKETLYGHVKAIGKEDGFDIADSDKQWGKTFCCQDFGVRSWVWRLARAWDKMPAAVEQRQAQEETRQCQEQLLNFYRECEQRHGQQIAFVLFKHCPTAQAAKTSSLTEIEEMKKDLMLRAEALFLLDKHKRAIAEKYVVLPLFTLHDKFREKELSLMLCPSVEFLQKAGFLPCSGKPAAFFALLDSLVKESHDLRSAELLLDVILKRFCLHPRPEQCSGAVELRELKQRGMRQAEKLCLSAASESRYKSVFSVVSEGNSKVIIAKYKPNCVSLVAREVKGYGYDSILALGMTPPTGFAKLSMQEALQSLKRSWEQVERKFQLALSSASDPELAKIRHGKAQEAQREAMAQFDRLPDGIKRDLYAYFSTRIVRGHEHYDDGQKGWHDRDLMRYSAESRALAIQDFLSSERYKNWIKNNELEAKDSLGSIQCWIKGPASLVNDLLYLDERAGEKLKQMPKVLVHLHCILGLVKGTGDGHPGNTMVRCAQDGSIQSIHEFDDERTLMDNNEHRSFRMYQFGLPQAMQPFDRTTLMLFSEDKLLRQICAYNRSDRKQMVNKSSYEAQEKRVAKMIQLFQEELRKEQITLTPQELFFKMLGGRDSYFYWTKQMCQNPLEVFEYRLSHFNGIGKHFASKAIASQNFNALYDLETNAREKLEITRQGWPSTQLIVKFNAGYGNNLFIKKALPQGGEDVRQLQCLGDDLWVWEADDREIGQEMEYKLWFNNQTEERYPGRRKLVGNQYASRFVVPEFW